jgi:hypothetical protein
LPQLTVQTSDRPDDSALKAPCRPADASAMKRTLTIMIAGLTAVFALGACGAAEDAVSDGAKGAIESATGCKVDEANSDNAKVECKGKDGSGSFSVGTGELPDGFPKSDVPLPDGKVVSSISTEVEGKTAYVVTVKVDGSVGSASDDYKQALEGKGFTVDEENSFSLGGSGGLTAFQVEGTDWDVNVVGAGGTAGAENSNGLVVTVSAHDSSTDTTS